MTRVVLMGKGALAAKVGRWLRDSEAFDLEWVVPSMPAPGWTESVPNWCEASGQPWIPSGRYEDIPGYEEGTWSPELVISIFYSRIVGREFIAAARRIVNFHNAPLPKYRGVNPINWALRNGECEHGVTLHEMTPGIDEGAVIGQTRFSIYPEWDEVEDIYERCLEEGWLLIKAALPRIMDLPSVPQVDADATYYSKSDRSGLGDRSGFRRGLD